MPRTKKCVKARLQNLHVPQQARVQSLDPVPGPSTSTDRSRQSPCPLPGPSTSTDRSLRSPCPLPGPSTSTDSSLQSSCPLPGPSTPATDSVTLNHLAKSRKLRI